MRKLKTEKNCGENNPFYGKKHSDDTKAIIKQKRSHQEITEESNKKRSISLTGIKRKRVQCPHCNKNGDISLMTRYHFNNCKERPS